MTERRFRAVPTPTGDQGETARHWLENVVVRADGDGLVHVLGSAEDAPRLAPVIWALEEAAHFEQRVLASFAGSAEVLSELNIRVPVTELPVASMMAQMRRELAASPPAAVLIHSEGETAAAACITAARLRLAVVHVGRASWPSGTGRAVARLADMILVPDETEYEALTRIKVAEERVHVVGSPLIGAVRRFARLADERDAAGERGLTPGGYTLVIRTSSSPWPEPAIEGPSLTVLAGDASSSAQAGAIREPGFIERLSLERSARLILTDSERAVEEATALGVQCQAVGVARPAERAIALGDWRASSRIAEIIVANFARIRLV